MIKLLYIHTFLRSTKWNANLILTSGFPQLVALCTVMHQSIPAVPIPPPPRVTAGHLLTLSVPGVGHLQFYRGPGAGHLRTPGRPPGT